MLIKNESGYSLSFFKKQKGWILIILSAETQVLFPVLVCGSLGKWLGYEDQIVLWKKVKSH